jgi:hypothetical protein
MLSAQVYKILLSENKPFPIHNKVIRYAYYLQFYTV